MSVLLWLDDPGWYGMNARTTDRPAAGPADPAARGDPRDTLACEQSRPNPRPHGPGLTDEEERQLLDIFSRAPDR